MPLPQPLTRFLCIALLSLALPSTAQAALPDTFKNIYSTRIFGIKVTVTHELSHLDDGEQQLRFEANAWIGNIEEISRFRWSDETVQPKQYFYKRTGLGRNREAELTFDWANEKVINDVQGHSWQMDINQNVQDKLSYQIQLQKDLIEGRENLVYSIADGGELKEYRFQVVARERLDTPLGEVDTVKVKRSRDDDDRATYAWLAPEWDYLLIQLEQIEGGDSYSITINKARVNGRDITSF